MEIKQTVVSPRHLRIVDEKNNVYRDYFFLDNSEDIDNKIFWHVYYFIGNTKYRDNESLIDLFSALCHKVNVLKNHLENYKSIEKEVEVEILEQPNLIDHDGAVLVERVKLTAEYEAILMQHKATLDILVKFLNIVYRDGRKKQMKFQDTFKDKGQGVIRSIEKYLIACPEDNDNLRELLGYLKKECSEVLDEQPDLVNGMLHMIRRRDDVSHYKKIESLAFAVKYEGESKTLLPPRLTKTMYMTEGLEIAYDNLLIFIQDFIALLFSPYLEGGVEAYTYRPNEIVHFAPRWYLQLGAIPPSTIWQSGNILGFIRNCQKDNQGVLTPDYCEEMYLHYGSFLKGTGITVTSEGIEIKQGDGIRRHLKENE